MAKACDNPLCRYRIAGSARYCCDGCARAHEGGYEIHEDGILGHSPLCARRQPEPASEPEIMSIRSDGRLHVHGRRDF